MASAGRGRGINTTIIALGAAGLRRPVQFASAERAIADAASLFFFGAQAYDAGAGSGGITFGSAATVNVAIATDGAGGITFGSAATINVDINVDGAGGLAFGGAGDVEPPGGGGGITYEEVGAGGLVFAGESLVEFTSAADGGIAGGPPGPFFYPRRRWPCSGVNVARRRQRCQGSFRRITPCPDGIPPQQTCIGIRLSRIVSNSYSRFSHISSWEDFEEVGPIDFGGNMLMTRTWRPAELDARRWWEFEDFVIQCRHDPAVQFTANRANGFADAFVGPFQYYDQFEIGGRIYVGVSVAVTAFDVDVSMHWVPLQRPFEHSFMAATCCPWGVPPCPGGGLPTINVGPAEFVGWHTRPDNYCFYDIPGDAEWLECQARNSAWSNVEVGVGSISVMTLISGIVERGDRWADVSDRLVTSIYSLLWSGYGGGVIRGSDGFGYLDRHQNLIRGQFINLEDPETSAFLTNYYRTPSGAECDTTRTLESFRSQGTLPGISYFDVP